MYHRQTVEFGLTLTVSIWLVMVVIHLSLLAERYILSDGKMVDMTLGVVFRQAYDL